MNTFKLSPGIATLALDGSTMSTATSAVLMKICVRDCYLRLESGVERRLPASFFFLQEVDLGGEALAESLGAGLGDDHASVGVLPGDSSDQQTHVVACLSSVELFPEGLDARDGRPRGGRSVAHQLDFIADFDLSLLDRASDDGASAFDVIGRLDGHQERLVDVSLWHGDVVVHDAEQLFDFGLSDVRVFVFETAESRAADELGVLAIESVFVEDVFDVHLDDFEHLLISHQVAFVDEHDDVLDADLSAEQDVLAGLRHGSVGGRHDQDASVHLGRTGDHVLDVVFVAGAVHMAVVSLFGHILDGRGADGDACSGGGYLSAALRETCRCSCSLGSLPGLSRRRPS